MRQGIQASAARRLATSLPGQNFPSTRSQVFLESVPANVLKIDHVLCDHHERVIRRARPCLKKISVEVKGKVFYAFATRWRGDTQFGCFGQTLRGGVPHTPRFASCVEGLLSWQAVDWILRFSESTYYERLVLISIASHADKSGKNAFPSLDTISREALICRREVIYCVQKLEEMGELRVERGIGRGNSNRYELPMVSTWLEKRKGAQNDLKGAQEPTKGARFPNSVSSNGNGHKELQEEKVQIDAERLREPRTVKEVCQILSIPKPSKAREELRAEADRQIAAMREKGYLQ
jgi:hypothetical protein